MELIPGTDGAMKFISEMKDQGYLVDIYDSSEIANGNNKFINRDRQNFIIENHGDAHKNHLLVVALIPGFPIEKLIALYPTIKTFFSPDKIPPTFLFLNLHVREGLVIRRTRKGAALFSLVSKEQWYDEGEFNIPEFREISALDHAKSMRFVFRSVDMISRGDYNDYCGEGRKRDNDNNIKYGLQQLSQIFPKINIDFDGFIINY